MKNLETESKREDNWKKYPYLFNEGKNLNFECECGKKYVSFPGLYLHFQRKHGIKISTKISPNQCVVINEDFKTTYKYMHQSKKSRTKKDNENGWDSSSAEKYNVLSVLQRFIEESSRQLKEKLNLAEGQDFKGQMKEVVVNFKNFIFEKLLAKTLVCSSQAILYQIPYFCNSFMEQITSHNFSLPYQQICSILLEMSVWLRKQGFSELVLEMA